MPDKNKDGVLSHDEFMPGIGDALPSLLQLSPDSVVRPRLGTSVRAMNTGG
jgi:hypothetical protein